jgi:hypothetical protein
MQAERHADVDLHLRQTRSPAHALGNGFRHSRHFLILGSDVVRVSMSMCIVMRRYAAFPLLGAERRSATRSIDWKRRSKGCSANTAVSAAL